MFATTHSLLALVLGVVVAASTSAQVVRPIPPRCPGCTVEVLVDGRPLQEYHALGMRYVEALKGRAYAIRLTNPLDVRVAVALSVDGLNSIDARHTTASAARKWVIDPHESVTISGWQVSMAEARRFYFTSEARSYAQRLGQTDNLGIISAAFFRERPRPQVLPLTADRWSHDGPSQPSPAAPRADKSAGAAAGAADSARAESAANRASEEYAATGIGERSSHAVQTVQLDLEERPATTLDVRYEYRSELVRLGVLPAPVPSEPLDRRQRAQGFDKGFCPDIK